MVSVLDCVRPLPFQSAGKPSSVVTVPAATAFAPVDVTVKFIRPVPPDGRDLVASGTVVHRGRTMAVAQAEIRNGDVTLQLSGSTDAGTAALRDSLDDLRQELAASGFGNCSLDLRDGGDQPRQQYSPARPSGGGTSAATPAPTATPDPAPQTAGRLDVRA